MLVADWNDRRSSLPAKALCLTQANWMRTWQISTATTSFEECSKLQEQAKHFDFGHLRVTCLSFVRSSTHFASKFLAFSLPNLLFPTLSYITIILKVSITGLNLFASHLRVIIYQQDIFFVANLSGVLFRTSGLLPLFVPPKNDTGNSSCLAFRISFGYLRNYADELGGLGWKQYWSFSASSL